jgi:multicomponent Na+:H+ antiporter subunit C
MSIYAYLVGAWLILAGSVGIVRSRNLIHAVVCLSVAQSGTYVLLLVVGFQKSARPPVFGSPPSKPSLLVVDPVVQAMTLTDVVVSATVTALLLGLAIQVHKRQGTIDPDELRALKG